MRTHKSTQKRPRAGPPRLRRVLRRPLFLGINALLIVGASFVAGAPKAHADTSPLDRLEVQSLDGRGNNRANPDWGRGNTAYTRVGPARYTDGRGGMVDGPNARRVSNRIHNDVHQNVFSENRVTQWGFAWGQWIDHNIGLRLGRSPDDPDAERINIPFDANDPLEEFENDIGVIGVERSVATPGTGVTNTRQQTNTVGSYIDGSTVYGENNETLEWLREGPVDGNMANNSAKLLLPSEYLPRRNARGNAATAPVMELGGRLTGRGELARTAGDFRANENIALTATHTMFAREHNRIVDRLPRTLTEEQKFQIARRIVIAEIQYITYTEFLPAVGVNLPRYRGYNPRVNANLTNEFATVGYRAHSMIHGELELETDVDRYTPAQLDRFRAQGLDVIVEEDEVELVIPLNLAFFNPDLLQELQLGPMLQGLGLEAQYNNEEQIDNQLRSVLFQIPVSGNPECLDGPGLPECFDAVIDLGAIDIQRGRDHGMPSYNQMRRAFGLPPKTSFRAITGEASEEFPRDPALTPGREIDDPDSLDFTGLFDKNGAPIEADLENPATESDPVVANRRAPLAARLKALYGSVDNVDAFVGMLAENHGSSSDFGELQRAIWRHQFLALRDGDRFFFGTDPGLTAIRTAFGIDFRRTLAQVIAANTDIPAGDLEANVFLRPDEPLDPARVLAVGAQRCMSVPSDADRTQVEIRDCDAENENQQWNQHRDGTIRLAGGKCLDALNLGTGNGTPVGIFPCHGRANQQWRFNADGHIVGVQSGKCLDVRGRGTANGTKIQLFTCANAANQRFIR